MAAEMSIVVQTTNFMHC